MRSASGRQRMPERQGLSVRPCRPCSPQSMKISSACRRRPAQICDPSGSTGSMMTSHPAGGETKAMRGSHSSTATRRRRGKAALVNRARNGVPAVTRNSTRPPHCRATWKSSGSLNTEMVVTDMRDFPAETGHRQRVVVYAQMAGANTRAVAFAGCPWQRRRSFRRHRRPAAGLVRKVHSGVAWSDVPALSMDVLPWQATAALGGWYLGTGVPAGSVSRVCQGGLVMTPRTACLCWRVPHLRQRRGAIASAQLARVRVAFRMIAHGERDPT